MRHGGFPYKQGQMIFSESNNDSTQILGPIFNFGPRVLCHEIGRIIWAREVSKAGVICYQASYWPWSLQEPHLLAAPTVFAQPWNSSQRRLCSTGRSRGLEPWVWDPGGTGSAAEPFSLSHPPLRPGVSDLTPWPSSSRTTTPVVSPCYPISNQALQSLCSLILTCSVGVSAPQLALLPPTQGHSLFSGMFLLSIFLSRQLAALLRI